MTDEQDLECRVCREGPSEGRPLYTPCLCSGSIMYSHQDCLEEWLGHSGKQYCELCKTKYEFVKKYAANTPAQIPPRIFLTSTLSAFYHQVLPFLARLALAFVCWLIIVPLFTSIFYRVLISSKFNLYLHFSESQRETLFHDIISGILLSGIIGLSFITLMSLVEFLRQYWMNDPRHHRHHFGNAAAEHAERQAALNEEEALDVPAAGPVFPPIPAVPAPRVQQLNPPVPQPDIDEEEDDDLNIPDIDEGQDVEIRIALHELLGVRGPLMPMLQFLFWLLVFNGCFVFMCVFLPYNVGYKASIVTSEIFTGIVVPRIPWVDMSAFLGHIVSSATSLMHQLSDTHRVLRIPDIIHLFNGYSIGVVFVLLFNRICKFGRSFVRVPSVILNFLHDMDWFCDILQITILLLCRIFWLPCLVGVFIILNINCLTQLSSDVLIGYATHYAVGFIAISWGLGIAFMLTSTIALLQLREVLHPDLLAHLIRPQEGHRDLLVSLLQDSCFTQCRRLITSLAVYLSIVTVFVSIPILAYREIFGVEKSHLVIRFCYFVPELQVPLEVLITHSLFLYLLEKYKDNIGIAQHRWLLRVCQILDLTRFLLPVQSQFVENPSDGEGASNWEVHNGRVLAIGEPMVRPPPTWDARTRRSTTRWAWHTDEKFELERSVAPRKAPRFWLLRMAVLMLATWLVVEVVVFSLTVLPIIIGRRILALFMIPVAYIHDPLCMAIGLYALSSTLVTGYKIVLALLEIPVALLQRVRNNRSLMLLIGKFALHWGVAIPLTIGYLYSLLTITKEDTSILQWLMKPTYLLSCWRLGTASLNSIYLMLIANVQDIVLNRLGLQPAFAEHRNNIVTTYGDIVQALRDNSDDVISHASKLYDLITKPFNPIFQYLTICLSCSFVLQASHVHIIACVLLLHAIYGQCKGPISYVYSVYYNTIKDEHYLIGRELKNVLPKLAAGTRVCILITHSIMLLI